MSADFKSHVLMRDEKGFAGVPFKRLLLVGVSGGMSYTLIRIAVPGWAVPAGIAVTLLTLILSATRGGLPLWQRLLYHARGSLLLAAVRHPDGMFASLARTLDLPIHLARLDSRQIFAPLVAHHEVDMREWVTFAHAKDADHEDGLVFVDAPMVEPTTGHVPVQLPLPFVEDEA